MTSAQGSILNISSTCFVRIIILRSRRRLQGMSNDERFLLVLSTATVLFPVNPIDNVAAPQILQLQRIHMCVHVCLSLCIPLQTLEQRKKWIYLISLSVALCFVSQSFHALLFFIHFIQTNSIAPLQVHYYSEALPTQHRYCAGISRLSATGNCEGRTCPRSLRGG